MGGIRVPDAEDMTSGMSIASIGDRNVETARELWCWLGRDEGDEKTVLAIASATVVKPETGRIRMQNRCL